MTHLLSNAPATTAIYTLSLHDALPISTHITDRISYFRFLSAFPPIFRIEYHIPDICPVMNVFSGWIFFILKSDRKSTRLNSSHVAISYAVFCLKKKKQC